MAGAATRGVGGRRNRTKTKSLPPPLAGGRGGRGEGLKNTNENTFIFDVYFQYNIFYTSTENNII